MAARGSTDDQLKALMRRVEQLEARAARERQPARHGIPRNPRPCKTVDGGTAYPVQAGGSFCFHIIFLDREYTEAVGAQTPTDTDRQEDPKFLALGEWVPEGTHCWAAFDKGQWWLLPAGEGDPSESGLGAPVLIRIGGSGTGYALNENAVGWMTGYVVIYDEDTDTYSETTGDAVWCEFAYPLQQHLLPLLALGAIVVAYGYGEGTLGGVTRDLYISDHHCESHVIGIAEENIPKHDRGLVRLYYGPFGDERNTGQSILAATHWGDVEVGEIVWCGRNAFGWYVIAAECDPTLTWSDTYFTDTQTFMLGPGGGNGEQTELEAGQQRQEDEAEGEYESLAMAGANQTNDQGV